MRRRLLDVLLSMAALSVVAIVLVSADDRVREQVSFQFHGADTKAELVDFSHRARAVGTVLYGAAKDQASSHPQMTLFVVAAAVLTVFMIRT